MKKHLATRLLLAHLPILSMTNMQSISKQSDASLSLVPAPEGRTQCKEITIGYQKQLPNYFNGLTPQERIMVYYLYRASLPGNDITAQQLHRHSRGLQKCFEFLQTHRDTIAAAHNAPFDTTQFVQEVETYVTYLWTNHSAYFLREQAEEKRSPERLGLTTLTTQTINAALKLLGTSPHKIDPQLECGLRTLFSTDEMTLVVPGNIEKSACNLYASDFTEQHFKQLAPQDQERLNGYCYLDAKGVARCAPYKIGQTFSTELTQSAYWLKKAYEHAQSYPEQFDIHFTQSLGHLITFLYSGDQNDFAKHSIAWTKSNSRIDYCFGFIENYMDPKAYRGMFQAEVTIKTVDMQSLLAILPQLEKLLPFPPEFQRTDMSVVPNASINTKAFATGELGPLDTTLAYCLPNDEQLRAEHGSKQIIYDQQKPVGQLLNPALQQALFNSDAYCKWAKQHDPEQALEYEIKTIHTILHETVGHASGRLATHTFVEGDLFEVDGKTYTVGQTIPVTNANLKQFLDGYEQALEELRAEINALTIAILGYDVIAESGLLGSWPEKIEKGQMINLFIRDMARSGIMRLISQPENATSIAGDHARANTTILNYLLDHGGLEYVIETREVTPKGMHAPQSYTVLDVAIIDQEKTVNAVLDLARQVQGIKSTADRVGVKKLIDTYGSVVRHPQFIATLKSNRTAVSGEVKVSATMYPLYKPVKDANGVIQDAQAVWPQSIIEQYQTFKEITYTREEDTTP